MMLLTADLHLRDESADVVLGEVLPGLYDILLREGDQEIAILGDLWHLRYRVPVALLNAVVGVFRMWARQCIRVHLLPGNHDQVDVHGQNALEVLGENTHVTVYTEPAVTDLGAWLPYRKDPLEMVGLADTLLEAVNAQGVPRVLFTHAGVRGATMNASIYDTDGIPLEALAGWDLVITGHYHRAQRVGNVQYLGSPWQTRADEAGQTKVVWGMTSQGGLVQNVVHWGPRHHRIEVGQDGALDLTNVRPQDVVQVATAAGVDVEALGKQLAAAGIIQHVVTPEVEATAARLEVAPDCGMAAYAKAYVELKRGDLDQKGLMEVFAEIQGGHPDA